MERDNTLEQFLGGKTGRFCLHFSQIMAIYRIVGYVLTMILLLFVVLQVKFNGLFVIICVGVLAAIASCVLLLKSSRQLLARNSGKTIRFPRTMANFHLSMGLQLLYTPLMSMTFCLMMRMLDGSMKVGAPYDETIFRAAWDGFGLCAMMCTGSKLAVCHMVERQYRNKEFHSWLLWLLAGTSCLAAIALLVILLGFRPEWSSGVLLRICMVPLLMNYVMTSVFAVQYWRFLRKRPSVKEVSADSTLSADE